MLFPGFADRAWDTLFRWEIRPIEGFSYVSPSVERLLGFSAVEFYQDSELIRRIAYDEDLATLRSRLRLPLVSYSAPIRLRRRSGETIWIEMSMVPILDGSGVLTSIEGIARDITGHAAQYVEPHGAPEAIVEQEVYQERRFAVAGGIAGQAAHYMNNLLSALISYPELIKQWLPEDHPAATYCDQIIAVSRNLAEVNTNLLALGTSDRSRPEQVSLIDLVSRVVSRLDRLPETLRVELELSEDPLYVIGVRAQIVRLLLNLIANAREAMDDSGTLTVRTEHVRSAALAGDRRNQALHGYQLLSVSDTGPGIPEEDRDRLFAPFFSTKRSSEWRRAGLGLSVVKAVAEDHGGAVDVVSQAGKGTTFRVYLPAVQQG